MDNRKEKWLLLSGDVIIPLSRIKKIYFEIQGSLPDFNPNMCSFVVTEDDEEHEFFPDDCLEYLSEEEMEWVMKESLDLIYNSDEVMINIWDLWQVMHCRLLSGELWDYVTGRKRYLGEYNIPSLQDMIKDHEKSELSWRKIMLESKPKL